MNLNRLKGLKIKDMINLIACFNFGTAFILNSSVGQAEIATCTGGELLHSSVETRGSLFASFDIGYYF